MLLFPGCYSIGSLARVELSLEQLAELNELITESVFKMLRCSRKSATRGKYITASPVQR